MIDWHNHSMLKAAFEDKKRLEKELSDLSVFIRLYFVFSAPDRAEIKDKSAWSICDWAALFLETLPSLTGEEMVILFEAADLPDEVLKYSQKKKLDRLLQDDARFNFSPNIGWSLKRTS